MNTTNDNEWNFYDAKAMSEIMEMQRNHVKKAVAEVKAWKDRLMKATNDVEKHYMNMEGDVLKQSVAMHFQNYKRANQKFFEMYHAIMTHTPAVTTQTWRTAA